jgi:hypothetical protein
MRSIKSAFILVVIVMTMALRIDADTVHSGGFMVTKGFSLADSSNLMVSVNITVLKNALAKGAGKCVYLCVVGGGFVGISGM